MNLDDIKTGKKPRLNDLNAWLNSIPDEIVWMDLSTQEYHTIVDALTILRREANVTVETEPDQGAESVIATNHTKTLLQRTIQHPDSGHGPFGLLGATLAVMVAGFMALHMSGMV